MPIVIKRNNTDISSSIDSRSVTLKSVLTKEVGQLKFKIRNGPSAANVTLGAVIDLYEDGNHKFGGTVTRLENLVEGGILIGKLFSCNDQSFRLNSQLVTSTYSDMDVRDIILDIVANFTDGTYTTVNVQSGSIVGTIKFNYDQVTVALEKLAKQIGWEWYVDADKDIHFFPPDTVANAPYTIDDTSGNLEWASLNIDQSVVNMKNSIYVIGGTYTKSFDATTTPDVYQTDGVASVFPIAYPYTADSIVVTLAGVSQTIGTDNITDPVTVQVLYNEQGRFIRFTSVPTTGQTIKVYGLAQIPILAQVQNDPAIATYGEIQDVIVDQNISSVEEAQQRGLAQIAQYGSPVYAIRFSTLKTGFEVGQTISINSTIFGVNVQVIIKRITGKMYSPTQMRYEVECVGTEEVNFVDIMKLLLIQNKDQVPVSDSTVLQVLLLVSESIAVADDLLTPTTKLGPYYWEPVGGGNQGIVWNFFTWG